MVSLLRYAHSVDTLARAVAAALALKPSLMTHFKVEETELTQEDG